MPLFSKLASFFFKFGLSFETSGGSSVAKKHEEKPLHLGCSLDTVSRLAATSLVDTIHWEAKKSLSLNNGDRSNNNNGDNPALCARAST